MNEYRCVKNDAMPALQMEMVSENNKEREMKMKVKERNKIIIQMVIAIIVWLVVC